MGCCIPKHHVLMLTNNRIETLPKLIWVVELELPSSPLLFVPQYFCVLRYRRQEIPYPEVSCDMTTTNFNKILCIFAGIWLNFFYEMAR